MVGIHSVVVLLAATLACCADASTAPFAAGRAQNREGMENLFERARITTGSDYVQAERQLRRLVTAGDAQTLAAIKQGALLPDPLAPLLAEVLLAAAGPSAKDYDDLEQLLVNLPATMARTALGKPMPDVFRRMVTEGYGNRATKFLALRLVKQPEWPDWLVSGVLLYLREHKDPATTAAIIRFAAVTPAPHRREWAREALAAIGDPALAARLDGAQRWAEANKLPFPPELRGITTPR